MVGWIGRAWPASPAPAPPRWLRVAPPAKVRAKTIPVLLWAPLTLSILCTPVVPLAIQKLTTEIKIHRSLRHESIVRFHRFFEDTDSVFILLEVCDCQVSPPLSKFGAKNPKLCCVRSVHS